jgi:hypothetical protein
MALRPPEEWEFWESLACSRIPLQLILNPRKRRNKPSGFILSDAAYVHRMFGLFFNMGTDRVVEKLTPKERAALAAFLGAWNALPWRPVDTHLHISDVSEPLLNSLRGPAQKLDRRLELRTGDTLIPILYRTFKGWRKLRMPAAPDAAAVMPHSPPRSDETQRPSKP